MKVFAVLLALVAGTAGARGNTVDLAISGIYLGQSNSKLIAELGKIKQLDVGLKGVELANRDGSEILTLLQQPGSVRSEFQEAILTFAGDAPYSGSPRRLKGVRNFKSELGISLGMSERAVLGLLGSGAAPKEDVKPNRKRFRYQVRIDQAPHRLKKFNLPLYFIDLSFENDRLVRYHIGFEQP